MIKDLILKIKIIDQNICIICFDSLKPINYYYYKNKYNNYEFCELDKAGRFINRSNTDFTLTAKEFQNLQTKTGVYYD